MVETPPFFSPLCVYLFHRICYIPSLPLPPLLLSFVLAVERLCMGGSLWL